jgi:hypothetical protein
LTSFRVFGIKSQAEEKTTRNKHSQLQTPIHMKKYSLLASLVAGSIVLGAGNALAQYTGNIAGAEALEPITSSTAIANVTLNSDPVVTEILSQPGTYGGHTYTGWSFLVNDGTGSLDIFATAASLTTLGYTPTVGDALSISGTYSPFHQIPEIETLTAISAVSSGNPVPSASIATIPQLNVPTLPLNIAGYFIELQNVTIGGTGQFPTFPTYAQATTATETYTVTDSANNSMTLFDWVTSYSMDAAMGGNTVPTGPVDIYGFDSVFGGTSPEFTPIGIIPVPEPTTIGLFGGGALLMLMFRSRKKA